MTQNRNRVRRLLGDEAYLFLGYATLTLRPGAKPPPLLPPTTTQPQPIPENWTEDDLTAFIAEAHISAATQQADKQDVRTRAQICLTTGIAAAGLLVTSFRSKSDVCAIGGVLYILATVCLLLTILASSGVISGQSALGAVSVPALTYYEKEQVQRTIAEGYAKSNVTGAETVAILVTVLRDCVLVLIIGTSLLGLAHLIG